VHPAHLCGRIITIMAKNFGQADFARRFWPKPVTVVLVAGTLVLCLANSPPAFCASRPICLVRAILPAGAAKPRRKTKVGIPPVRAARASVSATAKLSVGRKSGSPAQGESGRKSHREDAR